MYILISLLKINVDVNKTCNNCLPKKLWEARINFILYFNLVKRITITNILIQSKLCSTSDYKLFMYTLVTVGAKK